MLSLSRLLLTVAALLLGLATAYSSEVIPPAPSTYISDQASVLDSSTLGLINSKLAAFERATSNQIIVSIVKHLQSDSSVSDYCTRVAQSWGVGQKGHSNGIVLFIFRDDHKLYISTGYGLEGSLPDALCKRIIDEEITPYFKAGDYRTGIITGVNALMAASQGEYKGSGQTAYDKNNLHNSFGLIRLIIIFIFFIGYLVVRSRQHISYGRNGRLSSWGSGPWIFPGGGGSGGGFSGGGGGGGGFSGGGGSFGGGGSGGSW
jgi:uncharacterized protein